MGVASSSGRITRSEKKKLFAYFFELAGSMLLYAVLLVSSVTMLKHHHFDGGLRIFIGLVPVVGVVAAGVAIVRSFMRMDEFQRRTMSNAGAIAALATAVITFSLGFFENAGLPRIDMFSVLPIVCMTFIVALLLRRNWCR